MGHAAVFDSDSEEMGWFAPFKERIARGAFDEALRRVKDGKDDVYALLNHDENYVISSTADRTLSLSVDEVGLVAEMEPMDTQTIRDLVVTPIEQGKIRKMSFGFTVSDEHEEKREGVLYRIIDKVGRLFDVSPVTFPAYPATDVQAREAIRALGLDPERLTLRQQVSLRSLFQMFDVRLPDAERKAAPVAVAPASPAGVGFVRLRELELHLRDFDFNSGGTIR